MKHDSSLRHTTGSSAHITNRSAPSSSNRGIVCSFAGATQVLDVTNLTEIPLEDADRK